jgi:cytoskeletal protein CcmA (bactofilin family)
MPNQNTAANKGLGFLGEDLYVEGTIHSQKKMVVSGTVDGSIFCDKEIVVSETGQVKGKIEGNIVLVAGKINGDLLVHERLEVNLTANIQGEVQVPSGKLLIQEGAKLDAQCIILNKEPSGKKVLT